jgi:stage III sporulation protein AF
MVRNIIVIILLATFLELIIPVGNLRPMVRMTVGFFVILTILNPFLAVFFREQSLSLDAFSLPTNSAAVERAMDEGAELNRGISADMAKEIRKREEGQIRSLAMIIPGVSEVSPEVVTNGQGGVASVTMVVKTSRETDRSGNDVAAFGSGAERASSEEAAVRKRLTAWMESFYGLSPGQVKIKFE